MPRPTPYDIAFGPPAEEHFARIRESLSSSGRDPNDLDAFVLDRAVAEYLRDLVPEDGVGSAIEQHVALLHQAYSYWATGGYLVRLSRDRARRVLQELPVDPGSGSSVPSAYYVQFPERLVWAELGPGEPHQPLDGLFVRPWPEGGYFAIAIFGLHPDRDGFVVVDVEGYRPTELAREDGSASFTPVLPGGASAGLFSIVGEEELLELAARSVPLAGEAQACIGAAHRPHQPIELS